MKSRESSNVNRRSGHELLFIILALAVVSAVVAFVAVGTWSNGEPQQSAATASTVVASATQTVADDPLDKDARAALEAAELATAQADPRIALPKGNEPVPTEDPQRALPTPVIGILESGAVPADIKARFMGSNGWESPVGNEWLQVYAGALKNTDGSAGRGALAMYTVPTDPQADPPFVNLGIFPAPDGVGILMITAVDGEVVDLHAASGETLTFNTTSHEYAVMAQEKLTPTAAP